MLDLVRTQIVGFLMHRLMCSLNKTQIKLDKFNYNLKTYSFVSCFKQVVVSNFVDTYLIIFELLQK